MVNSVNYFETYPGDSIRMKIYSPKIPKSNSNPAIVMYHGGGWKSGHIGQFYRHAEQFSDQGIITVLVEYRTQESHGTDPFIALKDARSAMRYVKQHAATYAIDPNQIVAMGSSAGGHLALGTAMLDAYNHPSDDLSIDPTPSAIVTLSSILDTGPSGYGSAEVKEAYETFSPFFNIQTGLPPLLMFFGDQDQHTSPAQAQQFKDKWLAAGSLCELVIEPGQKHGYTGYDRSKEEYEKMMTRVVQFLTSLDLTP